MSRQRARGFSWLIAGALTAILFVCAFVFLDVRYANNDDTAILHAFQGYMNGEPATFIAFLHGLVVWPLNLLSRLAPQAAWYSYLQLTLLAVSCIVMAKSVMQIFVRCGSRLWAGALTATAMMGCLCLRYVVQVTFTHTAALLGAAAVLQLLSIEHEKPQKVIVGMMGSLALLMLSYSLRQEGALAVLAVCGAAFAYRFVEHYGFGKNAKRAAKPMLVSMLIVAVAMGGMLGLRELEIDLGGHREHMEWQDARSRLMDFRDDLSTLPQEAIDAAGWSPAAFALFKEWGFLDASLTTESFQRALDVINTMDTRAFGQKLADAWTLFQKAVRDNPQDMRCLLLMVIAWVLCVVGALTNREKRGRLLAMLLLLAALLAAMLLYLSLQGRLPARAILMAALPVSAAVMGLLPECLPRGKAAAAALVCAAYAVSCVWAITPGMLKNDELDAVLGNAMGDLEEYALWEPDALFVCDQTLSGADTRLFPEYPDGVPDNITFWGGWLWGSDQSREMWERFGVDAMNVDPAAFVNEEIYIASGRVDPPPELVLNWLREKLGEDVECEYWGENGTVYFFCFYQ